MDLKNKNIIVFGVANKKSIAYGIARILALKGANIALVYQSEKLKKRVVPIAEEIGCSDIYQCDVEDSDQLKSVFSQIEQKWERVDGVIHSIAFAPMDTLSGKFIDTKKEDFLKTFHISVYSLIEISKYAAALMKNGGSIITLSFSGSNRVVPGYHIMGPAKAALESSVRYLAKELGEQKIRVNAISAGPIKTLAASAFGGVNETLAKVEARAPLNENIDLIDLGNLANFLISDEAKRITGGIHYLDAGLNILGE